MWPSNVRYWSGWSSVWTARWLRPGSQGSPRGSAQDSSTPSCSSRRSQWRRVASCCWMTKRRCWPPLCAGSSRPSVERGWPVSSAGSRMSPRGSGVAPKSRLRSYSRSGRATRPTYPPAFPPNLGRGLAGELAVLELGLDVVAVHVGDEVDRDLLGAGLLALAVHGARGEVLLHGVDHGLGAAVALGLALRQQVEVLELGRGEQLGRAVGAGRHAGAAADAGGRVHGGVGRLLGDGDEVAVGGGSGGGRDVAARLHDAVERLAVDDEVAQHREGPGPPRLHEDLVAVGELAHVELAGGRALLGAVGLAVDHHPAGAADPLAAVVLEGDGLLALGDQPLVDRVEHLEEGHVRADAPGLLDVGDHLALVPGRLAPHVEGHVDGRVLPVAIDTHWRTPRG